MLNITLVLILSLFMISCSPTPLEIKEYNVDPSFSKYVSAFIYEGSIRKQNIKIDNLIIQFGEMPSSGTFGYCTTKYVVDESNPLQKKRQFTPAVYINKEWWDYFEAQEKKGGNKALGEISKRALIFHELGHCILQKEHNGSVSDKNYMPESLMYSALITQISSTHREFYMKHESFYLDSLFGLIDNAASAAYYSTTQ